MNIIITGGTSGLGESIVRLLAAEPANKLFITYARSVNEAQNLETQYANVKAFKCDFTDKESLELFLSGISSFSPDVLINNAYGSIHKEHFHKTEHAVFQDSFSTNIIPAIRITQEAIKVFRAKKSGKIINILSSAIVNKPPIGWSSYVANKAYMLAMSNCWATEGIKFNITSNCISPAFMRTRLTADTDERLIEQMENEHPLKKLLTTDEVSNAVHFLVNAGSQINGTNLVINAGADID